MAIVPIFIHVRERSAKEIHEEYERERRWKRLMEEEEAKKRAAVEAEKRRKLEAKLEAERKADEEWRELMYCDEWQTRILPGGWDLLGQRSTYVITERAEKDFPEDYTW